MKTKAILLISALALAGCGGQPFDRDDAVDLNAGAGGFGAGAGGVVPGSVNDPTSAAYFQQVVGDRVLFAVDQSTLSPEGRATLTAQAEWMIANPAYTALIEGHADEQGTREYNLALGGRRANSARDFLVSQGVPASRMRTISYGKERPLQICSTEACYSQNRRAVTVLAAGAGV
ncbi:peptidoglycan-associated lipoprotein Pal [Jannaschia sp. M317]|uniref:peptidoglycan-associated lipoprotein Pal n=1 Tax=Jannaschia sp. M317 TaxID=2867011 RepID=UPI0021A494B8|nr:peptidoglycan-associated lipoprotein Pal [Jannaschia sp. M317]UWQ17576.1 peptidoglycan-associated lipoprotein Pal [Jannaschia sp. M317]